MNDVQKLQLDILVKFHEVCKKHGLRYYLAFGTCLGAVRHKGFIPWDHDIDVLMPADDAVELEKYQSEFSPCFSVDSYRTNPSYGYTNMRISDTEHKMRSIIGNKQIRESYVSMDIYLLYDLPKNKATLLLNIWRSHFHKILVGGAPKNHGFIVKLVANVVLGVFGRGNKEKKIEKIEDKLNYKGNSTEVADYFGQDISFCNVIKYKKEWFAEPEKLLFEGYEFDGPTDPDKYLTQRYGNYMKLPSKEQLDREPRCELIK